VNRIHSEHFVIVLLQTNSSYTGIQTNKQTQIKQPNTVIDKITGSKYMRFVYTIICYVSVVTKVPAVI